MSESGGMPDSVLMNGYEKDNSSIYSDICHDDVPRKDRVRTIRQVLFRAFRIGY